MELSNYYKEPNNIYCEGINNIIDINEPTLRELRSVSHIMDASHLRDGKYLGKYAWSPVPDEWLNGEAPITGKYMKRHGAIFTERHGAIFRLTRFGQIQCKSRKEFTIGDIMIIEGRKGKDLTETYIRLDQMHLDEYEKDQWNLLPDIVVPEPEKND